MGCTCSISLGRNKQLSIPEVVVLVPALRVPLEVYLMKHLKGILSEETIDRLSTLRRRILLIAEQTAGSAFSELQKAIDEYLPLLLGLTKRENILEEKVKFKWKKLGDDRQEICIPSCWYELLSLLHMMAVLVLSEANLMLIPKYCDVVGERKVPEDCKISAIDLLLKASGYLDYCVRCVMVRMPLDIRMKLPKDLQEGMLQAISLQILGQVVEIQLGLAVENQKASLSVKRRLACEQVSYFAQTHFYLSQCIAEGYGKKHLLFLKWKYLEAKAAAYYYHGHILDKGTEPSSQASAVRCFLAAAELLTDSKKTCFSFCLEVPINRAPPAWGVMKHLHKKIPETASKKTQMYAHLFEQNKVPQDLPDLPDFPVSLRPEEYDLPEIDPQWANEKCEPQVQKLKEHLKDDEDET